MNTDNNTNIENQNTTPNVEPQATPVAQPEVTPAPVAAPVTPQPEVTPVTPTPEATPVTPVTPVEQPIVAAPQPEAIPNQEAANGQSTGSEQTTGGANTNNTDPGDKTSTFSKEDIKNGQIMAVLSYIGFLALIPYFTEKSNSFVIYHAKQGMNLFILDIIASVAIGIVSGIFSGIGVAGDIIIFTIFSGLLRTALSAAVTIFMILGIINVVNGQAKELPIIGKFKIIK